jgi:hypothetical protein
MSGYGVGESHVASGLRPTPTRWRKHEHVGMRLTVNGGENEVDAVGVSILKRSERKRRDAVQERRSVRLHSSLLHSLKPDSLYSATDAGYVVGRARRLITSSL